MPKQNRRLDNGDDRPTKKFEKLADTYSACPNCDRSAAWNKEKSVYVCMCGAQFAHRVEKTSVTIPYGIRESKYTPISLLNVMGKQQGRKGGLDRHSQKKALVDMITTTQGRA